jgi:hypothetical protein
MSDRDQLIIVDEVPGTSSASHTILSPNFQKALEFEINKYLKENGDMN